MIVLRKSTGAPILVSLPHFLDGSQDYLSKVEGLKPERDLHETFIELEPVCVIILVALSSSHQYFICKN